MNVLVLGWEVGMRWRMFSCRLMRQQGTNLLWEGSLDNFIDVTIVLFG